VDDARLHLRDLVRGAAPGSATDTQVDLLYEASAARNRCHAALAKLEAALEAQLLEWQARREYREHRNQ
jgi:hypothetical protein